MTRSRRHVVLLVGALLLIGAIAAVPATLGAADGTELTITPDDAGAESTHTWTFDDVDYDGEVDTITVDYPVGTSFDGLTNDDVTVELTREGESEPTDISVNSGEYGGSAATFDLSGIYNTDIDGPVAVTVDGLENPPAGEHAATLTFDGDDTVSAEAEFATEGDDEPAPIDANLELEPATPEAMSVHTWSFDDVDYAGEVDTITVDYPVGTSFDGLTDDDVTVELTREGEDEPTEIDVNSGEYDGSQATFDLSGIYTTDIDGPVAVTIDDLENPPAGEHTALLTLDGDDTVTLGTEFVTAEPTDALAVTVLGADGEPVADSTVALELEGPTDAVALVETDAGGVATVAVADAGAYDVTVTEPDAGTATGSVDVNGPTAVTLETTVAETGAIEALVTDADGEALPADTWVSVDGDALEAPLTGQLDEDGFLTLTGVAPGEYTLAAETTVKGVTEPVDLTVVAGDTTAAEFTYGTQPTTATLAGSVATPDGEALTTEPIVVEYDGPDTGVTVLETDDNGEFEVPFVPAGEYEVTVTAQGFAATEPVTVDAAAGERADVVLAEPDSGVVSGVVTDEDGDPLPEGTWVTFSADGFDADRTARLGPNGAFSIDDIAPGSYDIVAETLAHGVTDEHKVNVATGETSGVEISYAPDDSPGQGPPSGVPGSGNPGGSPGNGNGSGHAGSAASVAAVA